MCVYIIYIYICLCICVIRIKDTTIFIYVKKPTRNIENFTPESFLKF